LLKDINPGSASGGPNGFYTFKEKVYFAASSNGMNRELWMTDGTSTGTEMFIDLDNSDLTESAPQILGIMGDFMYFSAKGPTTGRELWKTDGTIQGTTMVKDVNPGADNGIFSTPNVSIPYYFKVINDKFIFGNYLGTP
ncbi:MAG: hypothetical protein HYZ54_09265, partial [Ignavibacteriae bacterium]|nr:hypothetical protein [Ignavibacteriota bacterium]